MKKKMGDATSTWRPGSGASSFGYNEARKILIQRLGVQRDAHVVVMYDMGAATDVPRYLFEHLRDDHRRSHERLSLVVYSNGHNGGNVEQACALASLLRDHVRQLEVLIAHQSLGTGTLLAFGADAVLLHPLSQVGGLRAAASLAGFEHYRELNDDLAPYVSAVGADQLGQASYQRARLRAGLLAMISGRVQPRLETTTPAIDELLSDETCPLSRTLERRRARELPWPVEQLDADVETTLWELHCAYEGPLDLTKAPTAGKAKMGPRAGMVIESVESLHVHQAGLWTAHHAQEMH